MTPKPLKVTPAPLARRPYGCCATEAEKRNITAAATPKDGRRASRRTRLARAAPSTTSNITHLLEKGHAIANQSGRYPGHVAGDHVIEGVYNEVAAEFAKGGEQ